MENEEKKNVNGEFLRGEIYWITVDDSVGAEMRTGRPAVIISGDKANATSPTVIVAYMSHSVENKGWNRVRCSVDGTPSVVCCEQLRTVDKMRIGNYKGCLSKEDMTRLTGALASAMCIPLRVNTPEGTSDSAEVQRLRVEADMYKGMYELVLRQLISTKVSGDLEEEGYYDTDEEVEDSEEESEPEPEPVEEEEEPSLVDLNTCTETDLRKCGCNPTIAKNIIARRPYKKVCELKLVPQLTRMGYILLEKQVCVNAVPVKEEPPKVETSERVEKVNINTATAEELSALTGLSVNMMWAITGYRKRNGEYKSVSELANVPRLSKNFLERFGDKLTV